MDVFEFAYFPFLNGALRYVEAMGFKLNELFYERAFEPVRARGKERVLEAIGGRITRHEYSDRAKAEKELLSYPVARILISCIKDGYLVHKYAHAEAENAYEQIKKLPESSLKELTDDFNIGAVIDKRQVAIHFTDYIRYASAMHGAKWKLVNRNMNHGKVFLINEDFLRVMQEAIRKRVESGMPLDVPKEICASLNSYTEEIRNTLIARKSEFSMDMEKKVMPDCFPPCIARALSSVQAGENLPHSMRFALTSFLLNIGLDVERVIELFKVSPDFDEERTRYQVMHIHGSTGTVYKSPSCSTMITYGNCFGRKKLCERVSHPLGYYRKKAWMLRKGEAADT